MVSQYNRQYHKRGAVTRAPVNSRRNIRTVSLVNRSYRSLGDDVYNIITRFSSNGMSLLALILSVALYVSHKDYTNGVIGLALKDSPNGVAKWINANSDKFIGLTAFIPALLSVPTMVRSAFAMVVIGWVYLMPKESYHAYFIMSLLVIVYFRARLLTTRIIVVLTLVALMSLEFFQFKL